MISSRRFIFAMALSLGLAACKPGGDSSQAVVITTGLNTFKDAGDKVEVTGTWLAGSPFPRNKAHLIADKPTMKLRVADAVVVDMARPASLEVDLAEYPIEEWTDQRITTARTRCGSSERFVQFVIDRKTQEVAEEFSGQYPARILLGDGIEQFAHAADFRKQK